MQCLEIIVYQNYSQNKMLVVALERDYPFFPKKFIKIDDDKS